MSKSDLGNIDLNDVQKVIAVGLEVQKGLDKLPDHGKKVIDQFEDMAQDVMKGAAKNAKGQGVKLVNDFGELAGEGLKKGIDKLPVNEKTKEQLNELGNQVVGVVVDAAKDAIKKGVDKAVEVSGKFIGRVAETCKSIFSNICGLMTGKKTKAEAIEGIKGSWKEAGEKMKTSEKSKAEQVGTKDQRRESSKGKEQER